MTQPNVAHLNVHTAEFTPLADIEGVEAILYHSEDGTRIAGSFREPGTHTLVQDFDEFIYVIAGTARASLEGGAVLDLAAGDCCYLRQGARVTWGTCPMTSTMSPYSSPTGPSATNRTTTVCRQHERQIGRSS